MTPIRFSHNGLDLNPTPLRDVPQLAERAGVRRVLIKDEGERPFGNFKILGGMTAGLLALARETGADFEEIVSRRIGRAHLPRLICASDGNHGLAVAAAAQTAGAPATIFLHEGVAPARAQRIAALGAEIAWIAGTYDDAVDAARVAGTREKGLLVPDTSIDLEDPVVRDVMAGYRILTRELALQLQAAGDTPTHMFVQAGVGGLAAAMAEGLGEKLREPAALVVVEPETAACVGQALQTGRIERFKGDLHTSAEMLSCGEASAPAVSVLRRHNARSVQVGEWQIGEAVGMMASAGFATTPSGACGSAGLMAVAENAKMRALFGLGAESIVLLLVTERG